LGVKLPTVAKKVQLWWALLVGWLVNAQPAVHVDGGEHRPTIARIPQRHDPHSESEPLTRALAQPQGTEIAPVQPPPIRQFFVQPQWDDYIEAEHWAVQRSMQATMRNNTAAFALRSTWPAATPP
jgi:hypothetical protein